MFFQDVECRMKSDMIVPLKVDVFSREQEIKRVQDAEHMNSIDPDTSDHVVDTDD